MTYAPQRLTDLAHFWIAHGGVNLGIVGDTAHQLKGTSYHLGKDQLVAGAYSASLPRDKAGLTNAAAANDLGKLGGSLAGLQKFSVWLVAQVRANQTKYRDVREVIYSPDGTKVLRWDNQLKALRLGGDGTGQGDNSHRTHTHISWFRDSEARDKVPLFAPYFPEADMPALTQYLPGSTITVKPTSNIRNDAKLTAKILRVLKAPETWTIVGTVKGDVDQGSDVWYLRWGAGWEYTAKSNVTSGPTAPSAGTPDCTAAVKAATDPLKATIETQTSTIAAMKTEAAAVAAHERDRIATAEANRIKGL